MVVNGICYGTIATIIALSVGGWFALFKIRIFRELKPHMTVSQDVTYRHIGSQYIHIMGKASIHNSSKVAVQIDQAFIRVQAVAPISDNEVEVLFAVGIDARRKWCRKWGYLVADA